MSNLSSFVLKNTATTATVFSFRPVDVYVNGVLCLSISGVNLNLGEYSEGGHLICKASSNAWIVSPRCAEVSRSWYLSEDANTLANTCTSCTGWFVPTISQLQNPGYTCRTYWDLFSQDIYWSSTAYNATHACSVCFQTGSSCVNFKNNTFCVRAFRCVTY